MAKHGRQLHAQAGEIVDVEKPAIVDVVARDAVVGDAPELLLDQHIERLPVVVQRRYLRIQSRAAGDTVAHQRGELGLERARTFGHLRPPDRQVGEQVAHSIQHRIFVRQHAVVEQRADRQLVGIVSPDRQRPFAFVIFSASSCRL